jgi:hypothetical protein
MTSVSSSNVWFMQLDLILFLYCMAQPQSERAYGAVDFV